MKCPVCDKVNTSMLCPNCGFDSSRDYGKYPTFGPVANMLSASALQKKYKNNQKQAEQGKVFDVTPDKTDSILPVKNKKMLPMLIASILLVVLAAGILISSRHSKSLPGSGEPGVSGMGPLTENVLRMHNNDNSAFGSSYLKTAICSITFLDTLSAMPEGAWDVSAAYNGCVMAWVKPNGAMYDLYIGAEGGVWTKDCEKLFLGYDNVTAINFGKVFYTFDVKDMSHMFYGCKSLTELDLSSFDTSDVLDMDSMFYNCISLTKLNLCSFDTSNVVLFSSMFGGCVSLTELEISDLFVTDGASSTSGMFYKCPLGADYQHLVH